MGSKEQAHGWRTHWQFFGEDKPVVSDPPYPTKEAAESDAADWLRRNPHHADIVTYLGTFPAGASDA